MRLWYDLKPEGQLSFLGYPFTHLLFLTHVSLSLATLEVENSGLGSCCEYTQGHLSVFSRRLNNLNITNTDTYVKFAISVNVSFSGCIPTEWCTLAILCECQARINLLELVTHTLRNDYSALLEQSFCIHSESKTGWYFSTFFHIKSHSRSFCLYNVFFSTSKLACNFFSVILISFHLTTFPIYHVYHDHLEFRAYTQRQ